MVRQEDVDFLEHYGVKGMKWGVTRTPGVSRKTDRTAKKDAKESARAKMFYGDGAGTRRKLSKATVDARRKKDPSYGKAFDAHLARQDMSTHASKARSERSRKDKATRLKQRSGYFARKFTGEAGNQAAFSAAMLAGLTYSQTPKGKQQLASTVAKAKNFVNKPDNAKIVSDFFANYNK